VAQAACSSPQAVAEAPPALQVALASRPLGVLLAEDALERSWKPSRKVQVVAPGPAAEAEPGRAAGAAVQPVSEAAPELPAWLGVEPGAQVQ
jgi:hypothetical protein